MNIETQQIAQYIMHGIWKKEPNFQITIDNQGINTPEIKTIQVYKIPKPKTPNKHIGTIELPKPTDIYPTIKTQLLTDTITPYPYKQEEVEINLGDPDCFKKLGDYFQTYQFRQGPEWEEYFF